MSDNVNKKFELIVGGLEDDGEFHPNSGYWEPDGITYVSCRRCGINMRLETDRPDFARASCADCNYPEFRAPFEAGSAVEYLSVVAA